jgi:hypothetical protein
MIAWLAIFTLTPNIGRIRMIIRHAFCAVTLGLVLVLAIPDSPLVSSAIAQETQPAADHPGSIRQALEQQVGKRAKLKLVSGQDLEGKVVEVGNEVVVVDELTGMEFFGGTVRIDQVAAVIVRKRTQ